MSVVITMIGIVLITFAVLMIVVAFTDKNTDVDLEKIYSDDNDENSK